MPSSPRTGRRSRRPARRCGSRQATSYINDKPTGAVVGQQPFGGARASGTNDKVARRRTSCGGPVPAPSKRLLCHRPITTTPRSRGSTCPDDSLSDLLASAQEVAARANPLEFEVDLVDFLPRFYEDVAPRI